MSIPALEEAYHTRGNIPVAPNNTTAALIAQFALWSIKAALMDHHTAGATAGARNANSIFTCLGSSDGVTAGLDGNDRWGTTFNAAKIVRAGSGAAHSWFALRNVTNGYDICIDCIPATDGYIALTAVKSSQGFVGGSTTVRPQAASNSEEFCCGTTVVNTSTSMQLFADLTTGANHYVHFVTNADGSRWWWGISKNSSGCINGGVAFWKGKNGRAADTRNQWWMRLGATASGRGAGQASAVTGSNACTRRGWANAVPSVAGPRGFTFGGNQLQATGSDVATGDYLTYPLEMVIASTPPLACGYLPDLLLVSGGNVASNIPSAAAQERTIFGDLVVPCGVALNT